MKVFVAGFGTVGQGVTEVIASREEFFNKRYGRSVKIVGVMDSSTYVTDSEGLDPLKLVSVKKDRKSVV